MVIGISTSGNSANVIEGLKAARTAEFVTTLLGGGTGGKTAGLADVALLAPSEVVWQIQEGHGALIDVPCTQSCRYAKIVNGNHLSI